MVNKIQEYISDIDKEIKRCVTYIENHNNDGDSSVSSILGRVNALIEVKNDLNSLVD